MVPRGCTRSTIVRVWLGLRMNLIEYGGTEEFSSVAHILELDGAAAPIVLLCILQEEVIYIRHLWVWILRQLVTHF